MSLPMNPDQDSLLRDLALHLRGAIPILEAARIDYYCAGDRSIADGCAAADVDADAILQQLSSAAAASTTALELGWQSRSLVELLSHIDERYHRAHLAALSELRSDFEAADREQPDLFVTALGPILRGLEATSELHRKTSASLFADILALEAGSSPPHLALPTLSRIALDLHGEHVRIGSLMLEARRLARDYHTPGSALPSVRALYARLSDWELEAHGHAHLENNVLLPWSAEIDSSRQPRRPRVRRERRGRNPMATGGLGRVSCSQGSLGTRKSGVNTCFERRSLPQCSLLSCRRRVAAPRTRPSMRRPLPPFRTPPRGRSLPAPE